MRRPLEGTTIWCTRPGRAGERSCARLHDLGATIHHVSTVRIEPVVPAAERLAEVHRAAGDAVVALTSPSSATNFVGAVGPTRPDGVPWPVVAVGQKTAIHAKGLGLDLIATSPRSTARDLVPVVLDASDAPVVVVPGSNLRRRELADGLRAGGRGVLELTVQETIPLEGLPDGLPDDLTSIDVIVAYSPSALGFVRAIEEPVRSSVLAVPAAVMGPTTGEAARELGFRVAVEPADPDEDRLIGMICRWVTPEV